MTLGLYKVGKNQPITRIRRAGWNADYPHHYLPDLGDGPLNGRTLCGRKLGYEFQWNDAGKNCTTCVSRIQRMLREGQLVMVNPAVVAEFERQMRAHLGDRQAAAEQAQPEPRLAVEIYRPRDGVMGSAGTRREIHLIDCPLVSAVERPMVSLPVAEVLRLKNADSGRTGFCQECKPFHVLDNERRRPRTLAEARKLAETEGYLTRDRIRRTTPSARHRRGFRLLPHDGSMHFEDCPAEPEALLNGDVTDPKYGRCTCYEPDPDERPTKRRRPLEEAPEWTL
jgi:hypothetical protein